MRQAKGLYPSTNPGADFIKDLCEKPVFYDAVDAFRHKWKIDPAVEIHLMEVEKTSANQKRLFKNKKFVADLRRLQKKFQLGEEWSSYMDEYIFVDLFAPPTSNIFIEKKTGDEADQVTGRPAYYLRIFPETRLDDIAKSWKEINKYINGKSTKDKRMKPSKTRDRDGLIHWLASSRMPLEDIADFIKVIHGKEMDYLAIKTAEARYRNRRGIKSPNKLGYKK